MRRHRKAGWPMQPHWETRDTTQETEFAWIHWFTVEECLLRGRG